jgi:hypothetical protein
MIAMQKKAGSIPGRVESFIEYFSEELLRCTEEATRQLSGHQKEGFKRNLGTS